MANNEVVEIKNTVQEDSQMKDQVLEETVQNQAPDSLQNEGDVSSQKVEDKRILATDTLLL